MPCFHLVNIDIGFGAFGILGWLCLCSGTAFVIAPLEPALFARGSSNHGHPHQTHIAGQAQSPSCYHITSCDYYNEQPWALTLAHMTFHLQEFISVVWGTPFSSGKSTFKPPHMAPKDCGFFLSAFSLSIAAILVQFLRDGIVPVFCSQCLKHESDIVHRAFGKSLYSGINKKHDLTS